MKTKNKFNNNNKKTNTVNNQIENKKTNKKKILFLSLILVMFFVVALSSSYAFFVTTVKGKEFVIYTGNLAVNYEKQTNVINVNNAYPMTDTEGLQQLAHEFKVTNNGNIDARYQIRLELDSTLKDMIDIKYIKMSYQVNGGEYSTPVLLSDLNSSLVFVKDIILNPTESNTYGLKLWIDLSAPNEIQGKTFKARVVVDSIQNVEDGFVVDTTPIIYLNKDSNGNQDIHLKTNDTYQELGAERVEDDQEIFTPSQVSLSYEYYDGTNLSTVQSIDTSKNGIYYITYSITDKSGNIGKKVRVVTINPTDTIPTITLNGDATITLEETEVYNELGVTVENNNQVVTLGEVKTSTVGTYVVRYIVVDSKGNLNSIVRTINIIEATTLYSKILAQNSLIETEPTLTTTSEEVNENGLYKSTDTNSGNPTYYFRGNVTNNYVSFAGKTWRIVRINEDGTIRLILETSISSGITKFIPNDENASYLYFSESNMPIVLETWFNDNLSNYNDKIAVGIFCESIKEIEPNEATFKCEPDINNKGIVNSKIGFVSFDELVYGGNHTSKINKNSYLWNGNYYYSISPTNDARLWILDSTPSGIIKYKFSSHIRPVINLNYDVTVTGEGTASSPYKVMD